MNNTDPSFSWWGSRQRWNDPFMVPSDEYIPRNFYEVLDLALYVAGKNPLYYQASKRMSSYFITDTEFIGRHGDAREKEELRRYLRDRLGIFEAMLQAGTEYFIYGNSFIRIYYPFNRFLIDTRNGGCRLFAIPAFGSMAKFNIDDLTYSVPDPLQKDVPVEQRNMVRLKFIDRKSKDASRIKLMFLDPKRVVLNMNFASGKIEYIWRIEEEFRAAVKEGTRLWQINDTPLDLLTAIKNDQDFKFNEGAIFHMKCPFISGVSKSGWGIPPVLLNYNSLHHLQVLRCINEAIGLDYLTPMRLIAPAPTSSSSGSDAALATNLGRWSIAMKQLMEHKKKNPTSIHTVPFPVQFQELGGNGKALAPADLIKLQSDEVLDNFGIPAELWHGTMNVQATPTAMRMMQANFMSVYRGFNQLLKWTTKNILNYLDKDQIGVNLMMPSVADDMDRAHIWLQLASGGEISRSTAYRAFHIDDPIEEQRRRTEEDAEFQKIKKEQDEKLEREMTIGSGSQVVDAMLQAQGGPGGVAPGGAPPEGGGGAPMPGGNAPIPGQGGTTPLDIQQQAEEQAMQLLAIPDNGERAKQLKQIAASNPLLHAMVKQKMEEMRAQGASEGRKSVGKQ